MKIKESKRVKILMLAATAAALTVMFPTGESLESEVPVGSIWIQDDLIADFSFPIYKDKQLYRRQLEEAKEDVLPIFLKTSTPAETARDSLARYNATLRETIDGNLASEDTLFQPPTFLSAASYKTFRAARVRERQGAEDGATLSTLYEHAREALNAVYETGVLNMSYDKIGRDSISIRQGKIDIIAPEKAYLDRDAARAKIDRVVSRLAENEATRRALVEYVAHFVQPNVLYQPGLTREEIALRQSKVSRNVGIVNENERIVAKHDRVTSDIKRKIDSYKNVKGEMSGAQNRWLQLLGKFLHTLALLSILLIYLYYFRPRLWNDNLKLSLFALLFLWMGSLTYIANQIDSSASIHLLVFIPAASMMLTIVFDSRVGFYTTMILALMCAAIRGNDYSFAVMNVVAGSLAVYTVRDIQNRSQIFHSFGFILLGYAVAIVAFGLERYSPMGDIFIDVGFAAINALLSPALAYGLLVFLERIFGITTDLTLLELSNFDRPLLRELSRKAPGTFSHSVTIGTLAESAAEAIGANPMLARVGAYYHDIGKMFSPDNFVENQLDAGNPHDERKPEESAALIRRHVEKGIETAKQYKLPQEIIDFIPMHHGDMVITYFYEKAKELYGEENVDVADYRYPGPKPNSKETGILMVADACESAVRSLDDPDAEKIENLIANLIRARFESGQLDETPLTFADLRRIRKTFVGILLGQRHRRVRYPNQDKMESRDEASDGVKEDPKDDKSS
ncbi:MAG: HDIG domain-containing protein [Ignavibacteriales bacterium]|nr:HDIG domain-containing protein [Ignavibacteriales bacterium]